MDSAGMFSENGKGCGYDVTCSPTYPVRGICPKGWHLPSGEDWRKLIETFGDTLFADAERKLKSQTDWDSGAGENGTDDYGFSAIPAGFYDGKGDLYDIWTMALFWLSDETDAIRAHFVEVRSYRSFTREAYFTKNFAYSIRCVKD